MVAISDAVRVRVNRSDWLRVPLVDARQGRQYCQKGELCFGNGPALPRHGEG